MKKKLTALLCVALATACLLSACAGKTQKTEERIYKDGMFTDVSSDSPYRDYIAAAYEMGLMQGKGDGTEFGVGDDISVGEAVSYADKIHSAYVGDKAAFPTTEPWYKTYADYAIENKIIDSELIDFDAFITRAQFADILARCMPAAALPGINTVEDGAIPDVSRTTNTQGAYISFTGPAYSPVPKKTAASSRLASSPAWRRPRPFPAWRPPTCAAP